MSFSRISLDTLFCFVFDEALSNFWHLYYIATRTLVLLFFALFLLCCTLCVYIYQRYLWTCKTECNYLIKWCFQHPICSNHNLAISLNSLLTLGGHCHYLKGGGGGYIFVSWLSEFILCTNVLRQNLRGKICYHIPDDFITLRSNRFFPGGKEVVIWGENKLKTSWSASLKQLPPSLMNRPLLILFFRNEMTQEYFIYKTNLLQHICRQYH